MRKIFYSTYFLLLQVACIFVLIVNCSNSEQLRIGVGKYARPLTFYENGRIQGFCIDVLNLISEDSSLNFKFISDESKNLNKKFINNEIDLILENYSNALDSNADFSLPIFGSELSIFYIENNSHKYNLNDINGEELFYFEGSFDSIQINKLFPNSKIYSIENTVQAFKGLKENQFQFVIMPKTLGIEIIDYLKLENISYINIPNCAYQYCLAFKDCNYNTLNKINQSLLQAFNSEKYQELKEKWFKTPIESKKLKFLNISSIDIMLLLVLLLVIVFLTIFVIKFYKKRKTITALSEEINHKRYADFFALQAHYALNNTHEFIYGIDKNGLIIYANDRVIEKFDFSIPELLSKNVSLIDPKFNPEKWNEIFEHSKTKRDISIIVNEISNNDKIYYIDFVFTYVNIENSELVFAFGRDISDRILFEEKIIESEEKFKKIFLLNKTPMLLIEPSNYAIIDANKYALEFYGYSLDEILNKNYFEITKAPNISFKDILLNEISAQIQSIHKTLDNAEKEVELFITKIGIADKELISILIFDITQKNTALKALQQSEEKFAKAFKTSPDAIAINRKSDFLYIEVNDGFTKTFGYMQFEVIGKNTETFNLWKNFSDYIRFLEQLDALNEINSYETVLIHKNGNEINALISTKKIDLYGVKCILSVILDNTKQKRIIEQLKASEERSAALFKAIPDLVFVLDKSGIFIEYKSQNSNNKKLLLPPELFIGKSIFEVLPPTIAELTSKNLKKVFLEKEIVVYEYCMEFDSDLHYYEARLSICGNNQVLALVREIEKADISLSNYE